jgi:adenylate kinase
MIILMGMPGSGKGTQGKMLAETFGFQYVSTGEMLRHYATHDQIARMNKGELLNDQEMMTMIEAVLGTAADPNKILLDGFPRSVPQADWLLEQIAEDGFKIDHVFHLVVPQEVVHDRLLRRGRDDDTEESMIHRFEFYNAITLPILDFFKSKNIPVYDVNAAQTPEMVHEEIKPYLTQA